MKTLQILNMLHDAARKNECHHTRYGGDESTGVRYIPGFPGGYYLRMYKGPHCTLGTSLHDSLTSLSELCHIPYCYDMEKIKKKELKKIIQNFYNNN